MPTWNFPASVETILAYAWICSSFDLRDAVLQQDTDPWRRLDGQKAICSLMLAEVQKVEATSLYGCLLRHAVSHIDPHPIHATLTARSGIYDEACWEQPQGEAQPDQQDQAETPHRSRRHRA